MIALFSWLSKVIRILHWFHILRSVIGLENSRLSLNQSDAKLRPNHNLVTRVFPRFRQFGYFYFEFSLALEVIVLSSDRLLRLIWFWLFRLEKRSILQLFRITLVNWIIIIIIIIIINKNKRQRNYDLPSTFLDVTTP